MHKRAVATAIVLVSGLLTWSQAMAATLNINEVPEPSTAVLLGLGMVSLLGLRRRRFR